VLEKLEKLEELIVDPSLSAETPVVGSAAGSHANQHCGQLTSQNRSEADTSLHASGIWSSVLKKEYTTREIAVSQDTLLRNLFLGKVRRMSNDLQTLLWSRKTRGIAKGYVKGHGLAKNAGDTATCIESLAALHRLRDHLADEQEYVCIRRESKVLLISSIFQSISQPVRLDMAKTGRVASTAVGTLAE
jgi:hypothetical protein